MRKERKFKKKNQAENRTIIGKELLDGTEESIDGKVSNIDTSTLVHSKGSQLVEAAADPSDASEMRRPNFGLIDFVEPFFSEFL